MPAWRPCYPGGFLALTLKDEKGGMVSVLTDESLDLKALPPGAVPSDSVPAHNSEFTVGRVAPVTRAGTYTAYVSVGQRDGTPRLALPLANDDGQRRYKLGLLEVKAP